MSTPTRQPVTPEGAPIFMGQDALIEQLTDRITTQLRPGDRLPGERTLAEEYNASRAVIREALQRLRERGLIHIVIGSGAYVRESVALDWARPLDAVVRTRSTTTRELVEARAMLEEHAVHLACERATPQDVANLETTLAAFAASRNVIERARYDIAFHALVAVAAHNPVIEMMFGAIAPLVFEVMLRSLDDPHVVAEGGPYHETVLEGIRAGDQQKAVAAMTAHITLASEMFGDDFDAPLDQVARRKVDSLLGPGVDLQDVISWALANGPAPTPERRGAGASAR
jgi:GntR family transcriptional regulator, transcriptional repressor for pyruvate dehydrogenase complex